MHSRVHVIPYPVLFQRFLCTVRAQKPCSACIGSVRFGSDLQSSGAADRFQIALVPNAVQTARRDSRVFSDLHGHVSRLNGWHDVHNFATAGRLDPADPVEEAAGGSQGTKVMHWNELLWCKTVQNKLGGSFVFISLYAPESGRVICAARKKGGDRGVMKKLVEVTRPPTAINNGAARKEQPA